MSVRRRTVQLLSLVALNPFLLNLFRGRIYKGALKHVCVPALNCYSCPAAFGACPIGSLQVMLGEFRRYITGGAVSASAWAAGYVAGFIAFVGAVGGRFACGWLCPFGLLQDAIGRRKRPKTLPGWAPYVKYACLAVLVVALPVLEPYPASPRFCQLVCPAGMLEAGVPLVSYDRASGAFFYTLGALFAWKVFVTAGVVAGAVLITRFFCRTICPLGAAWGMFNRVSLVAIKVDTKACTLCGFCRRTCPVDISIYEKPDSSECIRCLKCTKCPERAVKVALRFSAGAESFGLPRKQE